MASGMEAKRRGARRGTDYGRLLKLTVSLTRGSSRGPNRWTLWGSGGMRIDNAGIDNEKENANSQRLG